MDSNVRKFFRMILGIVGACFFFYGLLSDRKWIVLGLVMFGSALIGMNSIKKLPITKMVKLERT